MRRGNWQMGEPGNQGRYTGRGWGRVLRRRAFNSSYGDGLGVRAIFCGERGGGRGNHSVQLTTKTFGRVQESLKRDKITHQLEIHKHELKPDHQHRFELHVSCQGLLPPLPAHVTYTYAGFSMPRQRASFAVAPMCKTRCSCSTADCNSFCCTKQAL